MTNDEAASACLNCGTPLAGAYCSACGQKVTPLAPTLGYFLHELTHELLHVDGKIVRSVRLLLTKPGFLTREILAGRRASYVSPIRLYLVFSVVALAVGALGVVDASDVRVTYTPDPGEVLTPEIEARMAETSQAVDQALKVWVPRAMFVLVPLFAALVMLSRRSLGRTYPQHLYFAVHVHAVWLFANAVNTLLDAVPAPYVGPVGGAIVSIYSVGYFLLAFHRVYETTVWGALWRAALIGSIYVLLLILTIFGIMAPFIFGFGEGAP